MREKLSILLTFIFGLTPGNPLFCQTEKQLVPSDLKQQTIVTEPVTLRKGFIRAGLQVNFRVADKYFNESGKKEYFSPDTWGSKSAYNLTLQYGINDRLQVDLLTEYLNTRLRTQSNVVDAGTNTEKSVVSTREGIGFGDTRLSLRYQIISEKKNNISVTGIADFILPTGEKNPTEIVDEKQYNLPVGNGTYALAGTLLARSIVYPYSFTAYIKYNYNFSGSKIIEVTDIEEIEFKIGNRFETGVSTNLHLNEWIVFTNKFIYYYEANGMINNAESPRFPLSWAVVYEPDLYFQVKRFRLSESVAIPLKGKNSPSDPLFVMLVQYVF